MKNKDIFGLLKALASVSNLRGVKFSYAVAKNRTMLRREFELFQEMLKPSKAYQVFEKARLELNTEMAEKKDGKPLIENGHYVISKKNMKKFEAELEALRKEHKKAIKEQEEKGEEMRQILEEECDVTLHKVKMDDVPADITPGQLEAIFEMVDDKGFKA